MIKLIAAWAAALLLTAVLAYKIMTPQEPAAQAEAEFSLAAVQTAIENRFETVDHLSADEFSAMYKADVLIFDTRPQSEYAVSHIENALQLDPNISGEAFATLYADRAAGKTLIFYCSVGHRSSDVAQRAASELPYSGPIYNLRGGIFGWHNEGRPLVDEAGASEHVHPYNKKWGRLVTRQDKLSYE